MADQERNQGRFITSTFISQVTECKDCGRIVCLISPWEEENEKKLKNLKEIHTRECPTGTYKK